MNFLSLRTCIIVYMYDQLTRIYATDFFRLGNVLNIVFMSCFLKNSILSPGAVHFHFSTYASSSISTETINSSKLQEALFTKTQ